MQMQTRDFRLPRFMMSDHCIPPLPQNDSHYSAETSREVDNHSQTDGTANNTSDKANSLMDQSRSIDVSITRTREIYGGPDNQNGYQGKRREVLRPEGHAGDIIQEATAPNSSNEYGFEAKTIVELNLAGLNLSTDQESRLLTSLLAELKELLSLGDALAPLRDDAVLLSNVLQEVELWQTNQGSHMAYQAQFTLAHSSVDSVSTTDYIDWNKMPSQISMMMYMDLMRKAQHSGILDPDSVEILQAVTQDSEVLIATSKDLGGAVFDEQLGILQEVGDYYVAYYNIFRAIEHVKCSLTSVQPCSWIVDALSRNHLATKHLPRNRLVDWNRCIQSHRELLMFFKDDRRGPILHNLAHNLMHRFVLIQEPTDLDVAIMSLQEAVDAPIDGNLRAKCIALLNSVSEIRLKAVNNGDGGVPFRVYFPAVMASPEKIRRPLPPLRALLPMLSEVLSSVPIVSPLRYDRALACNIYEEIDTWLSGEMSHLRYCAQIAWEHSAMGDATREYIDWGRSSAEISLVMYIYLMRRACDSGLLDEEVQEALHDAIQDTENWLSSADTSIPNFGCTEQLATLQAVGDYSVACYTIVDVIIHFQRSLRLTQPDPRTLSMMSYQYATLDWNSTDRLNWLIQRLADLLEVLEGTDRSSVLSALGLHLQRRFDQLKERSDIDAAIGYFEELIKLTLPGDPSRAQRLRHSASALGSRFFEFGHLESIDLAVLRYQEALSLASFGSDENLLGVQGLARSFANRFLRLGHIEDIDKAIELWSEAIQRLPSGSDMHVECLIGIGKDLQSRYRRLRNAVDIDSAIQALQAAYALQSHNAEVIHQLGTAFWTRFDSSPGAVRDLEAAITHLQKALELNPLASPLNLGIAYFCRFQRFGKVEDLDSAIEANQQAVDSTPPAHPDLPKRLSNLGNNLHARFVRLQQRSDLDKALVCYQRSLDLTPQDSFDRTARIGSLGACFLLRHTESHDLWDIDRAIELLQAAADTCHDNDPTRCIVLLHLGQGLEQRYNRLGRAKDLDLGIEALRDAVQLNSSEPAAHSGLSSALLRRYTQSRNVTDTEAAFKHSQAAIENSPIDDSRRSQYLLNHGKLLMVRYAQTHDSEDYFNAISAWRSSCSSVYGRPNVRLTASWYWATVAHEKSKLELAAEGYRVAIQLLPLVVWIGLGATSQLDQITDNESKIQNLACDAAACLIALADTNSCYRQQYLGQAVELLDQGRSILWSQASQLRQDLAELRRESPDLAQEFDQVGRVLNGHYFDLQGLSETDARSYRRCAQQWEELVGHVRKLPGFELFLLPSPISELRKAAKDGPIVVVNTSKHRSDVLIVAYDGELGLVPLSEQGSDSTELVASQASQFAMQRDLGLRKGRPVAARIDPLQTVLQTSWRLLAEPVLRHLEGLGLLASSPSPASRVWWCLTGSVTFIPIHAAHPPSTGPGKRQPGMMDLVVSSYTPTISALLRSKEKPSQTSDNVRMLAIGQAGDLPMVKEELETITKLVPGDQLTIMEGKQATVSTVTAQLSECTWAHFACHGIQDHFEPMNSGLNMHDKLLTLSKLAQTSLPSADFAFLSCCQSATGSTKYTNESVHIAAGMQFVGFRSVIGTLWSVGDLEARLVAEYVYKGLFGDGTTSPSSSEAALLLNHAVRQLRDEHQVSLERWVPFVHFGV